MAKKHGIGLPVRIVLLILNGCFIALLLLSYLCQLLNPQTFPKLSIFSILYPYTLIVNILFIIYWAITKNKHAFWSIIAIAIGWSNVGKFVQLKAVSLPENSQSMKIMSYNVHVMGVDNHSIHQKDSIISFLAEEQPDIICLQEFYDRKEKNAQQIISQADVKYFYKSTCVTEGNDTYGLITFSQYPIIDHGDIRFDNSTGNHASYIDIDAGSDTFRIYNIHLQSMHFANTDYSFARQATKPSGMTSDEFKQGSKALARKVINASVKRSEQVSRLLQHIQASPYKTILCGDFNDTPWSYAYRQLKGNKKDAFAESGKGFGNTMTINKLFAFRIDYILLHPDLSAYEYHTSRTGYSDHECIMTNITW
ncbi:MAG: endonuclease/exonuclease/phosphatase family protein [Bacteroidales bacterium]|nr:endonuclease/exonuclease/phosphatase family protein [Bacteroidales bacterium]